MSKSMNLVYDIIRVILYAYVFLTLGIVKGVLTIYIGTKILEYMASWIFGLHMIRGCDLLFYLEDKNNHCNCTCAIVLDRKSVEEQTEGETKSKILTFEELKQKIFIEKLIKGYSSFRKTMASYFGFKFWKLLPLNEEGINTAAKQIKRIDREFKNEEEIVEFMEKISVLEFPKDLPQWEIYVCEKYQSNKAIIVGKMHHGLMDGMGFMMLLASIDGDKNIKAIPQMRDIGLFTKVFLAALSPFFFAYSFFVDYLVKNDPSPFELKEKFAGKKVLKFSKQYAFEDLRKAYKQYPDVKFNDFFMGSVAVAIKKYSSKTGFDNIRKIGVSVPVSLRPPPQNLKHVQCCNMIGLGTVEYPVDTDLKRCMYEGNKALKKRFNLSAMWGSQKFQLMLKYIPEFCGKIILDTLSSTSHIVISNIPGLKEEITLDGFRMLDTYFVTPQLGKLGISILGCTYKGTFKFCVYLDKAVKVDANEFCNLIMSELDSQIKSSQSTKS